MLCIANALPYRGRHIKNIEDVWLALQAINAQMIEIDLRERHISSETPVAYRLLINYLIEALFILVRLGLECSGAIN